MSAIVTPRGLPIAPIFNGAVKPPAARPNSTFTRLASAFAIARSGIESLLRSADAMSNGPPASGTNDALKPPVAPRFNSTETPFGPSFAVAKSIQPSRLKSADVMPRAPGEEG